MASWRKAKLSTTALQRIREINEGLSEERLPPLQEKLLQNALAQAPPMQLARPYGLRMDCPKQPTPQISTSLDETSSSTSEAVNLEELASKIVEAVCSEPNDINIVIDLVSKLTKTIDLDDLMLKSWSLLREDGHKKSFLIAMSATRSSALSVGAKILLPLLSNVETFQHTLGTFGSALIWLEGNFSQSVVLPLLLDEQSVVNQDPASFKLLLNLISETQKAEAVALFCKSVQELGECHLQSLSLILESPPIDSSVVSPITHLLSPRMAGFAENRLVGKIILLLISLLSSTTSPQVYAEVSNLASHFKGPLRFRHKQALSKIGKVIQNS